MKSLLIILVTTFLLITASSQCFAMIELEPDVTQDRAKELGVEVRSKPAGTNQVNVWLEFKTQGKLEMFAYAQLQILDGERLVLSATLQPERPRKDSVKVYFSADHQTISTCTVMTVINDLGLGGIGYRFKLKDFLDLDKSK